MFDGAPEFETDLLPRIRSVRCFREPTAEEIERSYAAYRAGDWGELCAVWAAVAEPTRASVPRRLQGFYDRAGSLPPMMNGLLFLASVRAALAAGVRARQAFRPQVTACIASEFPWLEHRHEHIPDGYCPPFEFPAVFIDFINADSLEDVRARWQLTTGFNEVQQAHYSAHAAQRFRLPALTLHAARERELAGNYFGHAAPACTFELWRQCIYVLDALNAAVFDLIVRERALGLALNSAFGAVFRRGEWARFVEGLGEPQRLLPPPGPTCA